MVRLNRILRDYREAGAVNSLIGLWGFVDDTTILTKAGAVGQVYRLNGVDAECLDHAQRRQVAHRFERALRPLDESLRIYQYAVKRPAAPIAFASHPNAVISDALQRRADYFATKADSLFELDLYLVVLSERWASTRRRATRIRAALRTVAAPFGDTLSFNRVATHLTAELDAAVTELHQKAHAFTAQLADTVTPTLLGKQDAFTFFRHLVNYAPHKLDGVRLKYDTHLDFYVADSAVDCHRDHLDVDGYRVKALTMREPPARTFAGLLYDLSAIPSAFIACLEWLPLSAARIRRDIRARQRHHFNRRISFVNYVSPETKPEEMLVDDSATATVRELGESLTALDVHGQVFGACSLTLITYDRDAARLNTSVADAIKVFAGHDGALFEESYNLINTWLAVVPGNAAHNLRRLALLNSNAADLSFLFTHHTGDRTSAHLAGRPSLAVVETDHHTPYFWNLHYQDVGHTLIQGATGSGKSFLCNFLVAHAQQYDPFTVVFDLGGSYDHLIRLLGGSVWKVGLAHREFTINPFCLEPTKEHLHFLFSFVRVLIQSSGQHHLTLAEDRDLYDAVENLYALDPPQRRLLRVVEMGRSAARTQHAQSPGHAEDIGRPEHPVTAAAAVTYGKDRNFEREAVVDQRDVLRDALRRSMGDVRVADVKADFEHRVDAGELIAVSPLPGAASRELTTPEMLQLEHDTIDRMRVGQRTQPSFASADTRQDVLRDYPHLSETQRAAVDQVLASRDRVQALEGVAGAGKTTALTAVRDGAERAGYAVEGFAPTSRAAQQLSEAGIPSTTLQRHLAQRDDPTDGRTRLYVLDESSLASTRQMHAFLERLAPDDRVLLVGDVRQHQAVEAGRPYQQLHEAGIQTARLDDIVRQKDPALKEVVSRLARGDVREAILQLDTQGRVHEIVGRDERIDAMTREYMKHPDGTLVVSPDNHSRRDINEVIHRAMQDAGHVTGDEHRVRVLVPRQDVTDADRQWAERYEPGNVVRYTKGSGTYGLDAGEYVRVDHVNAKENLLTVERNSGEQVTYDPRRLEGVTIYRPADRELAVGDRVQFTAPDPKLHVANRELATIEKIEKASTSNGRDTTEKIDRADFQSRLHLRLDSGRAISLKADQPVHLDYAYAVTSHSSQGQTADRVLVHIDTERGGERLVNQRLAYVAVSRGRYDAQIYTNDKVQLAHAIGRDVSHSAAIGPDTASHELGKSSVSPAQQVQPNSQKPAAPAVAQGIGI